ncbi:MAG: SDR family NAD(P)-dependent oxidoreductase [Puniceicoccaceae bacterium]
MRVLLGGIAGGIGSALAARLLSEGHDVGGFGRAGDKLDALKDNFPDLSIYAADATDSSAVSRAVDAFVAAKGGLDAYVHAVGNVSLKPLHMLSDEDWRDVVGINLDSAFYAARACIGHMRKQRQGTLLFFSSVAAQAGLSNHEAIAAAKGGVSGLVRSIAATYASNGIRANAIAPGLVKTPATSMLTSNEQALRISERMHPLGRVGEADEIASLAAWMLSDHASWMTGQVISMDGGMGTIVPKPRA